MTQLGQSQYLEAITKQLDLVREYDGQAMRNFYRDVSGPDSIPVCDVVVGVLKRAQPIYADREIVEGLHHARSTFPSEIVLKPTDVPTPYGFVWLGGYEWEVPRGPNGFYGAVQGFCWSVQPWGLSIFVIGRSWSDDDTKRGFIDSKPGAPPTVMNMCRWRWGQTWDDEAGTQVEDDQTYKYFGWDGKVHETAGEEARTAMYFRQIEERLAFWSVLHFMQQKVVGISRRPLTRQMRRNPGKYMGEPWIDVVHFRDYEDKPVGPQRDGPDREWRMRWVVRGHWRKQPTKDGVKVIWISAFVKGPEGKPVKNAQKLFAVVR